MARYKLTYNLYGNSDDDGVDLSWRAAEVHCSGQVQKYPWFDHFHQETGEKTLANKKYRRHVNKPFYVGPVLVTIPEDWGHKYPKGFTIEFTDDDITKRDAEWMAAVEKVLSGRDSEIIEALKNATYWRYSNNSSGTKTNLQFRLPKRRAALRLEVQSNLLPHYQNPCVKNRIFAALETGLEKHFDMGSYRKSAIAALKEAQTKLTGHEPSKREVNETYGSLYNGVHRSIIHYLLERAPEFQVLLDKTITDLGQSGDCLNKLVTKTRDKKRERALDTLRSAIKIALADEITHEDVMMVLDEVYVQVMMDS